MNKKLLVTVFLIALFFSFIIYKYYISIDNESKVYYLLQVGAYKNYDNIEKTTESLDNYAIIKET